MASTSKGRGNLSPPSPTVRTLPLRIIRQPLSKPWRKPVPPPPQVFSVHPRDFRQLVQRLTGAEATAEASAVIPTSRPEISSAAPQFPVPPPPPLQPDSPALHPRPAITPNVMEHDGGGPAKYPDAAGGDGAAFLWDSTFPANSDWRACPLWSPQLSPTPPLDDCDSDLVPYF